MNKYKIGFWVATGLFSVMMIAGAVGYLINLENVKPVFIALGYPIHIIVPLAVAKILGILAITTRKSHVLKEWAYAGFCFELILAFMAHISADDHDWLGAIIGLSLLFTSYFLQKKAFGTT
jgi:hypothetical protein